MVSSLKSPRMVPGWTVDEEPDALGMLVKPPPEEMTLANRDNERIKTLMWDDPVSVITKDMALQTGMHHITAIGSDIERTDAFFSDVLGMRRVKKTLNFDDPNSAHWYWGVDDGKPGTIITYFERDPKNNALCSNGDWLNTSLCAGCSR